MKTIAAGKRGARLARARATRAKIAARKMVRLGVHRTNCHMYAQIFSGCGKQVLAAASTVETEAREQTAKGNSVAAAQVVGRLIAERAKSAGITAVAFDRGGFKYHGRVKALAEEARSNGLQF